MGISSIGVGSGLDVEGIIKQLTALEKQPLTTLQTQAATIQTRISTVAQIKSQVSALATAAKTLGQASSWTGKTLTSSNETAVKGSVTTSAAPTTFDVEVQQLAKAQSTASSAVAANTAMGTGTLTIDLGTWNYSGTPSFTKGAAASVNITIGSGEDTLSKIAEKINGANAGVTATVLRDASGERLLMRSNSTGEAQGFRIQVDEGGVPADNLDNSGLSRLAFDPANGNFGMAANGYQKALNTQATINGVAVSSANSTLADAVPGVTLEFGAVTTAPVTVKVAADTTTMKKNIQDFMAAYNSLSKTLTDATKYDEASKTGGVMQGDSVVVGLQNALRSLLGSSSVGSTFSRLADIGLDVKRGGLMTLNSSKLDTALKDLGNLQALFTADNTGTANDGFGLKIQSFADGLLATGGTVTNKSDALQNALKSNSKEQDKVNQRALLMEKRLRAQYSALDGQMAGLSSLSSYVSQQVAAWNKSSS
jgi:flagellar hook-associated protein 2